MGQIKASPLSISFGLAESTRRLGELLAAWNRYALTIRSCLYLHRVGHGGLSRVKGSTHGSLRISFGPVLDYDRPAWPPVMDALREPEAVEETSPGRFVVTVPGEGLTPIVNRFGSYYGDGDADVPSAELIVYVEDGLIARVTFDQASLLAWVDELAAE